MTTNEHAVKVSYAVDVPTPETMDSSEGPWFNVGYFESKAEAIAFIRQYLGPCDDEGRVSLLTTLDPGE